MKNEMHFGANSVAICGLSSLLISKTTADIQAVDCVKCLWNVLAQAHDQTNIIMNRVKVVTDEKRFHLKAVVDA